MSAEEFDGEMDGNDIAIVGMSCRVPGALNHQSYWKNLAQDKEALSTLTDEELQEAGVSEQLIQNPDYVKAGMFLENMKCFDAGFFGFSPQDAKILDPQHRHFIECAWEAFEDAGYVADKLEGTSVGVFAGSGHNAYLPFNLMTNPDLVDQVGFFLLRHTGNDKDFLATRVSYLFNLLGPSINVQTACSTSLVSVHMAAQSLLSGECDMALAGGSTIGLPHHQGYLYQENEILSKDGHCRPFDASSSGTVFGSGVGCVLLKRMEDALADGDQIHAVIKSSAINNDGSNKVSYLAPSVDGQAAAIREAIELADIDPKRMGFIECHGTGTEMGDPIEVAALTQAYGMDNPNKQYCAIGSVKANIGHLDTAAGVVGLIKAVSALKHKQLPSTIHYQAPNPSIDFSNTPFYVNDRLRDWHSESPRMAAVSSLGVGGTNAHVILEEGPEKTALSESGRPFELLMFSGRSKNILDQYADDYANFFKETNQSTLDICYTAATGRKKFRHRAVAVADSKGQFVEVLSSSKHIQTSRHKATGDEAKVAFMFAGGGAQYINMGKDLYEHSALYRRVVDECIVIAEKIVDFDLRALIFPAPEQEEQAKEDIVRPTRTLPVLFIAQYAQAKLWESWGIEPDAMIGHSMGEYTCACLAGVFSVEDAIAIVCKRGELFEQVPKGAMLSVMLDQVSVKKYLEDGLSLAAVNSQDLCVLSGEIEKIERVQKELESQDIQCRIVKINVAAHSHMLDSILEPFEAFLREIDYSAPNKKIASNLTGKWLTEDEAIDPKYWVTHFRETVQFSDGLSLLLNEQVQDMVLLEVGPGSTLSSFARQHEKVSREQMIAGSMRHPKEQIDDYAFMMLSLGKLWCGGVDIDWNAFYEQDSGVLPKRVSIPTYPFEKQVHWVAPGKIDQALPEGKQSFDKWFYQPSWKPGITPYSDTIPNILMLGEQTQPLLKSISENVPSAQLNILSSLNKPQLEMALDKLGKVEGAKAIVYALPLTQDDSKAFEQFFNFSKALIEQDLSDLKLSILVNQSVATNPSESVDRPSLSLISGAARVLASELGDISIRLIDIDDITLDKWSSDKASSAIVHETASAEACFEALCYRAGYRYVESFANSELPDIANKGIEPGVYVVTGGLGGLGLSVAELIAKSQGVKLALLSHREFPARDQWHEQSGRNTRIGRRVARLQSIAQNVDQVEVYLGDVSDSASISRALESVRSELGPIKGVFHTAGVIDDQLISMKALDQCQSVLAPKVQGAENLLAAMVSDTPDFVMLYSSVSALTGMSGQFDYAAANAYLDALAHNARAKGIPAVSVNWSAWQQVGMAAELATGERQMGTNIASFDSFVEGNHYRVYVDATTWWVDEHRTNSGLALVPGTGYIDQAYQAASRLMEERLRDGQVIQLKDLFFSSPMLVHDSEQKVMDIAISASGELAISSAASLDDADAESWLGAHVEGLVATITSESKHASLTEIQSRCDKEVIERKGSSKHHHMDFGKRWACVDQIYVGNKEVLAEMELPAGLVSDLQNAPLHPGMLDMATGAGHILVKGFQPENHFFVPISYGSVTVLSPFESEVFSHVQWLGDEEDSSRFDVTIYNGQGECLVEIKDFIVKRMGANALDEIDQAMSAELDVDLSLGILPEEGQEAIRRILSVPYCPQIIVSPECLDTVIARTRTREEDKGGLEGIERPNLDSDFEAPQTPFEEKMAELWSAALGIESIGVHDNFFELGGHSLLLTQLATKSKKVLGVALPLSKLFDKPTIREWAELADDAADNVKATSTKSSTSGASVTSEEELHIQAIERKAEIKQYALSPTQSVLWFVHEVDAENPAYNVPVAMRYRGSMNVTALKRSFEWLVNRHEILRTTYGESHGEMIQIISDSAKADFREHEIEESLLNERLQEEASAPFDLRDGSPAVCHLFKINDDDHVLLLSVHHIAIDHTALLQLMRELEAAYKSFLLGAEPDLSSPRLHYIDYAAWLVENTDEQLQQDKLNIWKNRLNGFSGVLDLPLDRARPAIPSGRGRQLLFDFDKEISDKVVKFSSQKAVSLYVSLLANFTILLSRYCKQEDVIVGTPFANRANQEELEDVVGCFINTLPLATNLAKCDSYEAVIAEVKEVMFEAYDNQDVPLNKIVDTVKPSRDPSYNPLFQVGFIFQEPPVGIELEGLSAELLPVHNGGAMYDIHLWIWKTEEGLLSGLIWYNSDIYEEKSMARLKDHFASLLDTLIDNSSADFRAQSLLTKEEEAVYEGMNSTSMELPVEQTLHGLISESAAKYSSDIAVVGEDGQLTYKEIEERSNLIASYLIQKGIQPGGSVGVSMSRRADMLVALLGILKTGACYIPMDPTYPKERLAYMAEQAEVKLIICSESVEDDIDYFDHELLAIDSQWSEISATPAQNLPKVDPESIGYVIFTSGSTGLPKGVQVPHRSIINFLLSMAEKPGFTSSDRLLAITTLSFDIAVLELYLPLISGGRTVIATEDEVIDGDDLKDLIEQHEINVMQATPSTWRSLLAAGWQGGDIKVMCGGEPFPSDLAENLSEVCREVWNMYGPTETTVWSTCRQVNTETPNIVGRPIANTQCYVVNDHGQLQPFGVTGELCIGGKGVTHGYLNRPELTEAVFVSLPDLDPATVYRTGDAVRLTENGELEYVQRIDNQVKVRGYRIELGEIESVILKHSSIAECAVMVREYSQVDKRIISYTRFVDGADKLNMTELRRHLRDYLPDYMIPQQLVEMDEMPLTPNGKIDRKALPDPNLAFKEQKVILEPKTAVEKALAEIWKEAIGIRDLSLDQYFFDIGGHSMLSIQVIYKIEEEFGVRLKATDMVLNTFEQIVAMLPQSESSGASAQVAEATSDASGEPMFTERLQNRKVVSESSQTEAKANIKVESNTEKSKKGLMKRLFGKNK